MANIEVFDSRQAAEQLGITLVNLQVWLARHPTYRPGRRISGDDLLWTMEDIERVRLARSTTKHGNRYTKKV